MNTEKAQQESTPALARTAKIARQRRDVSLYSNLRQAVLTCAVGVGAPHTSAPPILKFAIPLAKPVDPEPPLGDVTPLAPVQVAYAACPWGAIVGAAL
jgi:hypothetical protein